jgi:RimJ/RimL family protein N-acetyltransferase
MAGIESASIIEIEADRLRLLALTLEHLRTCLTAPERLEPELGFPVAADLVTTPVHRALCLKLDKMLHLPSDVHPWYTYWLMVIAAEPNGVGLIGFKGQPDQQGEVEIGYGIVPAERNRGYTTQAVRALIAWAFQDLACRAVVADSARDNLASSRVLAKVGMHIFRETDGTLSWRIDRDTDAARYHHGDPISGLGDAGL